VDALNHVVDEDYNYNELKSDKEEKEVEEGKE